MKHYTRSAGQQTLLRSQDSSESNCEDGSSVDPKDIEKGLNGGVAKEALGKAMDENKATFRLMQDSMNYTSFDQEKQCKSGHFGILCLPGPHRLCLVPVGYV